MVLRLSRFHSHTLHLYVSLQPPRTRTNTHINICTTDGLLIASLNAMPAGSTFQQFTSSYATAIRALTGHTTHPLEKEGAWQIYKALHAEEDTEHNLGDETENFMRIAKKKIHLLEQV